MFKYKYILNRRKNFLTNFLKSGLPTSLLLVLRFEISKLRKSDQKYLPIVFIAEKDLIIRLRMESIPNLIGQVVYYYYY